MSDKTTSNNTYSPDVLTCLANLSNDEVFTPPNVANAMLDMLPQELFRDPQTTFLDPACKSGVFLREIAKRLIEGLKTKFPNLQERLDHIFHYQLFGIAITELTSLLSRRSLYCSKFPNSQYSVTNFKEPQGNIRFKNTTHTWKDGKCVAAFRVQSPWTINDEKGKKQILKKECYLFDFALDRALRQISDYSCRLNIDENNPEKKVDEFINFLPVLAYDGATMKQISAQEVLDIALSGTSATLLARRWESALLVNVDNRTLSKLQENSDAMAALMKIEGFRALNKDIKTIINKSEKVKKTRKENDKLTDKQQEKLSEEEKAYKKLRKDIQEKLIKFATRIPIFMYLTDYRERTLKDVISQLEPQLFKKVTGLDVTDFEILCQLGVFNANLMNDAIFKFKRYEDTSLSYTGIDKHIKDDVGGWDTRLKRKEFNALFLNQQNSLTVQK